jgi:hypothetical protein
MANNTSNYGTRISATNTASGNVTATVAAVAGTTFYITDVSGSSDLAGAVLKIEDGSTVIWQDRIGNTSAVSYQFNTPLACTMGNAVNIVVTGTSLANANIAGFAITP